ncbi:hypothetical protein BWQ96_10675 [Gracilariopsis chorda]|uniref:Uncharacterized protein n=1 Tax=Gracilariopsis chorda TaxID=448386 RepID=A0A2V3IBZ2_9FLOR|nr:hypothetical protein BWQ96_10675 [Gracilariopsis chorda]|eukprot:PXF39627.1 hypothetical protein BWQ96_10675 [Gracilariopsis chorda]
MNLRPEMKDRLQATKDALRAANLTPLPRAAGQPNPTALYFANVRRGPIGEYRRILTRFLPGWAVLALSFIGRSTAEILTHAPYQSRLVASMRLLGSTHLPDYDPSKPFPSRRHTTNEAAPVTAMEQCASRWRRCANGRPPAVRGWYLESAETLEAAVEQIRLDSTPGNAGDSASSEESGSGSSSTGTTSGSESNSASNGEYASRGARKGARRRAPSGSSTSSESGSSDRMEDIPHAKKNRRTVQGKLGDEASVGSGEKSSEETSEVQPMQGVVRKPVRGPTVTEQGGNDGTARDTAGAVKQSSQKATEGYPAHSAHSAKQAVATAANGKPTLN